MKQWWRTKRCKHCDGFGTELVYLSVRNSYPSIVPCSVCRLTEHLLATKNMRKENAWLLSGKDINLH